MQQLDVLMPFIDDSESFALGYECGQIDQKLKSGSRLEKYLFHIENSAQVQMLCDSYGVKCFIEVTKDSTWALLTTHHKEDPEVKEWFRYE